MTRSTAARLVAMAALVCNPLHTAMATDPPRHASTVASRAGTLVTWQRGAEIGRERFSDDGVRATSDIDFNFQHLQLTFDRTAHTLRIVGASGDRTVPLPADTAVLENGNWHAFVLLAEQLGDRPVHRSINVLLPNANVTVPGTLDYQVLQPGPTRRISLSIGPTTVSVDVQPNGTVSRAEVPSQALTVLPEGQRPDAPTPRPLPAGVAEQPLEVSRDGVVLRGTLWRPAHASGRIPVVLVIAGSGPTDRDGNQAPQLQTDTYRMLAEALAHDGIATVRYDKRGVGSSGRNFDPAAVTIDDFVRDAAAWVARIRTDPTLGPVVVAGHSEGGLIALLLAQHTPVDGIALLATGGRTFATILHEQLSRSLDAATLAEADRVVADIRAGRDFQIQHPALNMLFSPRVVAFVRSVFDVDPVPLARSIRVPMVVIQGETDVQIRPEDARLLAAARPGTTLVLLPETNHLFKHEPVAQLPQASYTNAAMPLEPGLTNALVAFVRAMHTSP